MDLLTHYWLCLLKSHAAVELNIMPCETYLSLQTVKNFKGIVGEKNCDKFVKLKVYRRPYWRSK